MKMVKSLLLGSAAGLAVVSAGQAADLPVKAKPVEYVKVCSLYGAGFYYMPGTDICLKIGGYVRAETTYHSNGNFTQGPDQSNWNNRGTSELSMRARAYITADAREQTAWGTARAYVAVGLATADTGNTQIPSALGLNRAFIQWAGITAGVTQSFYDFYSAAASNYRGYLPSSDTGDPGWWVFAYTAQLGNGLSATISAEARRTTQMINLTGGGTTAAGVFASGLTDLVTASCGVVSQPGSLTADVPASVAANTGPLCYGGQQSPDIVGNIRLDQTWGSAQIMGVLHEDNAGYYGQQLSATSGNGVPGPGWGHPGDKWGFVVGAGLRLNFPMIAQGDYFQSQVNYTHGAVRYLNFGASAPTVFFERGDGAAYGLTSDCVYGAITPGASAATPITVVQPVVTGATGCQLTTAWSFNAAYEHYWTPQFHESFYGGYFAVRYNSTANNMLCQYESFGTGAAFGTAASAVGGCNNNWSIWSAGTRFQYDFTKTLYLGVDFLYQGFQTATGLSNGSLGNNTLGSVLAGQFNTATVTSGVNSLTPFKNEQNLAVTVRIHKDFLP